MDEGPSRSVLSNQRHGHRWCVKQSIETWRKILQFLFILTSTFYCDKIYITQNLPFWPSLRVQLSDTKELAVLCDQCHRPSAEPSPSQTETPHPSDTSFHVPLSRPPVTSVPSSVSMNCLITLPTSFKWNYIMFVFCDWLISLGIVSIFSRFAHVVACVKTSLTFTAE